MKPKRAITSHGRIARGPAPGGLVSSTIDFVERQLPKWRDDSDRTAETSEPKLNSQLCKFLDVRARNEFPMAHFHHEESQAKRRRIDISASPTEPTPIEGKTYTIYNPFLVIEGKRLPAPSSDREREYVTGFAHRTGGIQRFKLGLHGGALGTAVMVGYIQANGAQHWWTRINAWIGELANSKSADGCNWKSIEMLVDCREESTTRTAHAKSRHGRNAEGIVGDLLLFHLWIAM